MDNETPMWLSNSQLAERYGVSIDTVRKWRHEGTGPVGLRFGRYVRYSLAEIERWERERMETAAEIERWERERMETATRR